MIRKFIFVFAFTVSLSAVGQKTSPITNGNTYDASTLENLKKLNLDWSLPPAAAEPMNSGLSSLAAGDWKTALDFFDKVVSADTSFIPAYYFRMSSYEVGKKPSHANVDENYKVFRRKLPEANRALYADLWDNYIPGRSNQRRNSKLLETAPPLAYLSDYLVKHESAVGAASFGTIRKAFSSLVAARPSQAVTQANEALKLEPSVAALYLKAVAFQIMARHDSAFALFGKLVLQDKDLAEAHEVLAVYKQRLGDHIGTARHLAAISRLEPNSRSVWRFTGMMKVQGKDYFGGIIDLTKCLKADSMDLDVLKQRAVAETGVKDHVGAIRDLNSALRLTTKDLEIYLLKSDNYLAMGDSVRTIKILRDAEKLFQFDQALNLFTAKKLVQVNKPGQAQTMIDRVFAVTNLNNFNPEFLHEANVVQCEIYAKQGATDKEIKKLNALIGKEGDQSDYLFLRAKALLKKGDTTAAKADLDKLVKAGFKPAIELVKTL